MTGILITGFTPFDGREVNASWIAAQTYRDAEHLEIPVVWGEPMRHLKAAIIRYQPTTVISLGEGKPGRFDIETRASNTRKHRMDNEQQYPTGKILEGGPEVRMTTLAAKPLQQYIADMDIPIHISEDAGQFLCEETLYSLETLKTEFDFLDTVSFTHVPPFGTSVPYEGKQRRVDETLLKDFVNRLVDGINNL